MLLRTVDKHLIYTTTFFQSTLKYTFHYYTLCTIQFLFSLNGKSTRKSTNFSLTIHLEIYLYVVDILYYNSLLTFTLFI